MKIDVQQTDRSTPDRPMWAGRALDRMKRIPRVIVADAAEHYERVIHEALEPSEVR